MGIRRQAGKKEVRPRNPNELFDVHKPPKGPMPQSNVGSNQGIQDHLKDLARLNREKGPGHKPIMIRDPEDNPKGLGAVTEFITSEAYGYLEDKGRKARNPPSAHTPSANCKGREILSPISEIGHTDPRGHAGRLRQNVDEVETFKGAVKSLVTEVLSTPLHKLPPGKIERLRQLCGDEAAQKILNEKMKEKVG